MNDALTLMKERVSVRKFKPDAVPQELIDQVVEAGLYAASGMNRQQVYLIVITDPTVRERIAKVNREIRGIESDTFYGAPVIITVVAKADNPTAVYDGSLALGNMMLEAKELGLGSCWIHRARETFEKDEWQAWLKEIGIEDACIGIGNLALGFVDGDEPKAHERKEGRVVYIK